MKSPLVISSLSVRDPEYLNSLLICSIEEEPGASKKLIDLASTSRSTSNEYSLLPKTFVHVPLSPCQFIVTVTKSVSDF